MLKKNFINPMLCMLLVLCFSSNTARAADVLYILSMDQMFMPGDNAIKDYIEGLGHTVTYLDDDEDEPTTEEAAAAADLVYISESVSSDKVRLEITEIETPIVTNEAWAYDEMGLANINPDASGQGIGVANTEIEIIAPEHPLAATLTGTVTILSDTSTDRGTARFSTGIPGDEAIVIAQATLSDDNTYDVIYCYEKGAQLALAPADGSPETAADIRVCFGFDEISYLAWNENAFLLFEAAINFALGISIQPIAYSPNPSNGQQEVSKDADLIWRKGLYADTHNVYFGTDFNDVNEACLTDPRGVLKSENQTETIFELDTLEYGTTYYWRVDEVNAPPDTTIYKGNLWSFTTQNFLIIDDFETYDVNNIIYEKWDDYYVNNTGMTVGYFDPPYIEEDTVRSGSKSMPLYYDNDGTVNEGTALETSGTSYYSETEYHYDSVQDWTKRDVESLSIWYKGHSEQVGDFIEEPDDTYTITAAGADIWDTADEFHFAYKEVSSGTCQIIVKVDSLQEINQDSKAGVMVRDSLEPGARNASLLLTPHPDKGLRLQIRNTYDGLTVREDEDMDPNAMAPYWLKLQRTSGGLIRAYRSPNGSDWTAFSLRQVSMQMPIYIGLAVSSHDTEIPCTAEFSNVSFSTADLTSQAWSHQDVGIISNEAEPMFVSINDTKIYNSDPNASLIDEWTEWLIPMQDFADAGVNLTSVSSLGIGFGDSARTQPGGKGTIFIDDIRLNLPPIE